MRNVIEAALIAFPFVLLIVGPIVTFNRRQRGAR